MTSSRKRNVRRGSLSPALGILLALPLSIVGVSCSGDAGGDGSAGGSGESGPRVAVTLDASYGEPFSFLSGVREMPDGTLLAADPLSQVLLKVDMDAQAADTLGRVGEGPEEYQQPDRVFPLPGDSTLLVDIGNMRLTTIDPAGEFVDGMPLVQQVEGGGPGTMSASILMPSFVDARGNLYFSPSRGMDADPPDTAFVARYDRGTEALDTVASFWVPELQMERSGNNVRISNAQMEGQDGWAVGPDGRVAIVRRNGYSVEWTFPDGRTVQGPSIPFETVSITEADKEAITEERGATGLAMMMTMGGDGGANMMMRRGGTARMGGGMPEQEWAEVFPPFREGGVSVSPAGEAWVERWGHATDPRSIDVFDGQGVRIATVELPAGSRIIGFGTASGGQPAVYVTRMDEVGLWWLERYSISRR